MKIRTIIFAIISLLMAKSYAQKSIENNIVGKSIHIQSNIMGDERTIQVYLPNSYNNSNKKYPVLYLLDGQRYFLHGVSLQNSFVEFNQTLEFIIVGIPRNPSDRNSVYTVNSNEYLEFIEKEIMDYIEDNYRVTAHKIFFGWAFGGGFVLETMITKPRLFDAYMAASPYPVKSKIAKIDSFLTKQPDFNKLIYFSSETSEGEVYEGTSELNILLKKKNIANLSWTFKELASEEHRSTPFTTLYHGISKYFYFYPELQFDNLEDFNSAGGLEYVYSYYQKRATQYGFPNQPSDWTMFSITRNAIRSNNFEQFDAIVSEFKTTNFIERLRISRASLIAEFYLKNYQYEKAEELFKLLIEKHPNSEVILKGLGDTYKAMSENKKAKIYYEKVKNVSQNQKDN